MYRSMEMLSPRVVCSKVFTGRVRIRPAYICALWIFFIPMLVACQHDGAGLAFTPSEAQSTSVQPAGAVSQMMVEGTASSELDYSQHAGNDQSVPRLFGLAVHDPLESVLAALGAPHTKFTMQDGIQAVDVYQYEGFQIGIDAQQAVLFIDVFGPQIDTGIPEIYIGGLADEVKNVLGEPTGQTRALYIYEYDEAVLKLDLDPATGRILSIKLFAA
jgi:hypothetical protein